MIRREALLAALRRMQVETGSLVCLGCGYEHNCSIHGCAIIRETIKALESREPAGGKSLTVEHLQAVPHGKVKDNTLNDICKRANEIAMQRVLTVPETNADRIRAMSDEELAKEINRLMEGETSIPYCRELPVCDEDVERDALIPLERCEQCVLQWLHQPAVEE